MDNKKKMIISVVVVLLIGIMAAVIIPKLNSSNQVTQDKEGLLTLEYGVSPDEKYDVVINDESHKVELPQEVDVMKVGETEHTVDIKGDSTKINILVEDTQKPVVTGFIRFEVETGTTKKELEDIMNKSITAQDPIDGTISLEFDYNDDFDLTKKGDYIIKVIAKDINDNKTSVDIDISVIDKEEFNKEHKDVKEPIVKIGESQVLEPNETDDSFIGPPEANDEDIKQSKDQEASSPVLVKEADKDAEDLPENTELIGKDKDSETWSYNYKEELSNGGSINEIVVSRIYDEVNVVVSGNDNSGQSYASVYSESTGAGYTFNEPDFTDEDYDKVLEVAERFAK